MFKSVRGVQEPALGGNAPALAGVQGTKPPKAQRY